MNPIRGMIARRRPAHQSAEGPEDSAPITNSDVAFGGASAPAAPEGFVDRDLEAAQRARDAVPSHETSRKRGFGNGESFHFIGDETPAPAEHDAPRRKIWDMESAFPSATPAPAEPTAAAAPAGQSAPTASPGASSIERPVANHAGAEVPARDPIQPRRPQHPAQHPAQHSAQPQIAPAKPSSGGRVKTRLLGFHTEDLTQDIFDAPSSSATGEAARFPIGWLVVIDGPGRGHSYTLTAGLSSIGRGTDQSVTLDYGDASISRQNHAAVAYDEDENKTFIGHGGKSNIVRLNGKPLLCTEELAHGDRIRIGKTTLQFVAFCTPDFRWAEDDTDGEG